TILREGTLDEAGMKPDAKAKIDGILKKWAGDTDEAFAVLVARHGVIVFHEAYGVRDDKPMTVDTWSWMASITKCVGSTLMMMCVDQGLVSLDDTVDKFFPSFRGVDVKTPMTVRNLYTHTTGLGGGESRHHDFDEQVAGYYPLLDVGVRYEYSSGGMTLGGKVIEMVSGEALPMFYANHLLGPLGCTNTTVYGTNGDAQSVPMDMAKIAQMLLNKGAYGNMRFFSEDTFKQMLPGQLAKVLGPNQNRNYGIGTTWFEDEGLGKGTFAHGAASSATLRIDPENDLVIVMCRNTAGKNYAKYHGKFIRTVANCVEK
ncbi:serine hydrolase domain-containing protein, partial [Candidatus Hydrogenedentota bacterium]